MKNETLHPRFDSIGPYTDYGIGIFATNGTVTDYAYAWPEESPDGHATGYWQTQTGHYDIADEESGDYYVTPDTLSAILKSRGYSLDNQPNRVSLTDFIAYYQRDNRFEVPKTDLDYTDAYYRIESFVRDCGGSIPKDVGRDLLADMLDEENALRREKAVPGETVKDWYRATYPLDDLGEDIDPDLDFAGAADAVSMGGGFYDAIGVGDSAIRERIFKEIAARYRLDYGDVYGAWLDETALPIAPADRERPAKPIRAVLIGQGELPKAVDIVPDKDGSDLSALQELVGGNIEPLDVLSDDLGGVSLYINEEGLYTCPPNRAVYATDKMADMRYISQMDYASVVKPGDLYTVLMGNIVAVGFDPETGESRSLTDEQVSAVTKYFTDVSGPGSGEYEVMKIQHPELAATKAQAVPGETDISDDVLLDDTWHIGDLELAIADVYGEGVDTRAVISSMDMPLFTRLMNERLSEFGNELLNGMVSNHKWKTERNDAAHEVDCGYSLDSESRDMESAKEAVNKPEQDAETPEKTTGKPEH